MRKFYVLVLSAMFAMGPIAVVAEEPQNIDVKEEETVEASEVIKTIGTSESIDTAEGTESDKTVEEIIESIKTNGAVMVDDRFGAGDYINVQNKTFNNSVFFAGNSVIDQSNAKTGLGFFVGRDLLLSGNYEYGIHAADKMIIDGIYERDLFAIGGRVSILKDASIARDVFVAAEDLTISTDLHGDAFVAANKITFEDLTIDGNLRVAAKEITFKGQVTINGEFLYNDNAIVKGDVVAENKSTYHIPATDFEISNMMVLFFQLAGSIVFLLVFMFVARNFFKKLRNEAETNDSNETVTTLFSGVCAVILMPVIAAVLMLTIVGIPAGLIMLLGWIVLLAVSSVTTAFYVASKFMPNMNSIIGSILVLVLFAVVSLVPYLSIVARIFEICFGFGLIFRALFAEKKSA